MTIRSLFVLLLLVPVRPSDARQAEDPFAWDDATIYRIVTDRFSNGDSDNDGAYGRGLDGNGTPYDVDSLGHFLGGDFRGITGWIEDGYFTRLGVNTLQISAPYEQVHGWTSQGRIQKYAFDGSMALDYTETDEAFGSRDDFRRLVETAHAAGLRVLIEVNLAGPGPPTLHDMVEMGFGEIRGQNWRSWRPSGSDSWSEAADLFLDHSGADSSWAEWWGPDWVRADLPGYQACGDACPPSGVAFRTDTAFLTGADSLKLPRFLQRKWDKQKSAAVQTELDAWFEQSAYPRSAAFAVVKWVADWVEEFGLDGVVVTDAAHVDQRVLQAMKQEGRAAVASFLSSRDAGSDAPFWLVTVGHAGDAGVTAESVPDATYGPPRSEMSLEDLTGAWTTAAAGLVDQTGTRSITTLSTSDPTGSVGSQPASTGDAENHPERAAQLLLTPGPVALVYGSETARLSEESPGSDPLSMMNWITMDEETRAVWSTIGSFRAAHPAVARGGHEELAPQPLTFFRGVRIAQEVDRVVVVMGAKERTRLNVARIWPDDVALRDAMTGRIALVTFGQVTFTPGPSGILLIEELPE